MIDTKYFGFDINFSSLPQMPNLYLRVWKVEFDILNFSFKGKKVGFNIRIGLQ